MMLVKRHERVMLSKKKDAKNCKFADYSLSYDDIMHTARVFISGKNFLIVKKRSYFHVGYVTKIKA